jgi:hypothetical protein
MDHRIWELLHISVEYADLVWSSEGVPTDKKAEKSELDGNRTRALEHPADGLPQPLNELKTN